MDGFQKCLQISPRQRGIHLNYLFQQNRTINKEMRAKTASFVTKLLEKVHRYCHKVFLRSSFLACHQRRQHLKEASCLIQDHWPNLCIVPTLTFGIFLKSISAVLLPVPTSQFHTTILLNTNFPAHYLK
jgi:hypothetical protein